MADPRHDSDRDASANPSATSLTLIEQVQQGDAAGWRRLVQLYGPLVLWWCGRWHVPDADREDIAQEVFQVVHARVGGFIRRRECGSFRAWLRQITRNVWLAYRRRMRAIAAAVGGSDAQARLAQLPAESDDGTDEPDEAAEHGVLIRQSLELFREAFGPQTWELFWRHAVKGQPAKDVAETLGTSVGAVLTAKSRVLGRLRRELGELLD
jgi:RNA polymerase sigma-70 factor (ECF subfamily)